uniref:Tc1-like transposase DDE domain-containing protein n=1 Tax=Globisporangium ultimum (strain ATCC 200006 / CBS 805.95 / DAOM BR144) TaxID=431595 RepID=K3WZC3_GLOUD
MPKPETVARQLSKQRILRIAQKGGDWKTVADALEVKYKTAWLWVSEARKNDLLETPPAPKSPWGGKRAEKIKPEHLEFLERLISENCFITLREMAEGLLKEFGLKVVQQTIQKRLHCMMYSLRKVQVPDHFASLDQQKRARLEYMTQIEKLYQSTVKQVFYIDETNYNIWCAKKMERCRNLHVLACLSDQGVALWEHASGALKPEDMNVFVKRALDAITQENGDKTIDMSSVVLVLDNATCFANAQDVLVDEKYRGVTLLRLPSLSSMLNPCDSVFAAFKTLVKQFLQEHEQQIVNTPEGKTVIEHRSAFLVRAAVEKLPMAATAEECAKSVGLTRSFAQAALKSEEKSATDATIVV